LRGPLRGGEGRCKGAKGKEREEMGKKGREGEVISDAQLEQGRRLAKAVPALHTLIR